jgi:Zn-dependent M16 (insulinase) family peptidase
VDFNISGDTFDLDLITEKIGITPTKTRRKEECPVTATAITYWRLSTEKETCTAVSYAIEDLIGKLAGKEIIIKEVCNKNNLRTSFNIVIEMISNDGPELVLTREIVSFMSFLDAEIDFDLYVD